MSLRIYDSAARQVRDFEPLEPGKVSLYLCGPTVQGAPHLGHLRAALNFDVLVRWCRRLGLDVTYVRNVTDIDDKILAKAAGSGVPWWELAAHFEREFDWAYRTLNTVAPSVTPHATGHIPAQIALVKRLLERNHAYSDGAGNVYFSVSSLPDYGSLTNQRVANLTSTEDPAQLDAATEAGKRDPRDFALWKAAKPDEPADASWDSPWGRGRPGWHLECSAMSQAYLGDTFDIHGGGLDLRFPHHENEQAQSHGAGWGFARYWMHNAWLTLKGEKMSKSVGNVVGVRRLLERWPAAAVRLAVVTVHYRTNLEFAEDTLTQAAAMWDKFTAFIAAARSAEGSHCAPADSGKTAGGEAIRERDQALVNKFGDFDSSLARKRELAAVTLPEDFVAAMNDDLNVPGAMPALHRAVKAGHAALDADQTAVAAQNALELRAMLDVLGLDPLDPAWGDATAADTTEDSLSDLAKALLELRAQAKAAKDWERADEIRNLFAAAKLKVIDTPEGATFTQA